MFVSVLWGGGRVCEDERNQVQRMRCLHKACMWEGGGSSGLLMQEHPPPHTHTPPIAKTDCIQYTKAPYSTPRRHR